MYSRKRGAKFPLFANNPLGLNSNIDKLPFHPYFTSKDLVGFAIFGIIFSYFIFFQPNLLGLRMAGVFGNIDSYYSTMCWNSLLLLVNTQSVSELLKGKDFIIHLAYRANKFSPAPGDRISLIFVPTPSLVKICKQGQSAGNQKNNDFFTPFLCSPPGSRWALAYHWSAKLRSSSIVFEEGPQAASPNSLFEVGSSETTRVTSYNHDKVQFGYWLAGLIDGDGSLLVSKLGHPSIEITLHEEDVKTLYKIKYITGFGSVSKRTNSKAYRIRFTNKQACITVINLINGKLLTPAKHLQLIKICKVLNISPITTNTFSIYNAWFSGFFDAEGYISVRNKYTLTLSVAQKDRMILEHIKMGFNCGNIHYDKSWDGYNFNTTKRDSNLILLDYFNKFPLLTIKNVDLITFRRLILFLSRKYHYINSPYKYRIDHLITLFRGRKKI